MINLLKQAFTFNVYICDWLLLCYIVSVYSRAMLIQFGFPFLCEWDNVLEDKGWRSVYTNEAFAEGTACRKHCRPLPKPVCNYLTTLPLNSYSSTKPAVWEPEQYGTLLVSFVMFISSLTYIQTVTSSSADEPEIMVRPRYSMVVSSITWIRLARFSGTR